MAANMTSRNFGHLSDVDPLLAEYGLQAELYAYSDPNASLSKSRQFGELLAKWTVRCPSATFGVSLSRSKYYGSVR